jgi:hypothetical protein
MTIAGVHPGGIGRPILKQLEPQKKHSKSNSKKSVRNSGVARLRSEQQHFCMIKPEIPHENTDNSHPHRFRPQRRRHRLQSVDGASAQRL